MDRGVDSYAWHLALWPLVTLRFSIDLLNLGAVLVDEAVGCSELPAIKNALEQKTRELEDEKRLLEILNEAGRAIASTLDLRELLQKITDAATKLTGAGFGAFFYNMVDESGGKYQLYTLSGAPREAFERLGHPRATPVFAPTFRGEGVVRSDDITQDARYGTMPPHHGMPKGHLPVRSYLAVPVTSRSGEVVGGLFFGHERPGVFSERCERLLVGVAAHAAIAIDNARLYEETKRASEERARLLEAERAARAELERVSVLKDEFLATLSHELRTPLNAVLGWSEMLLMRNNFDEQTKRGLDAIARNARAQAQMIEDLLDMNRIISGKIRLEVQRVDPAKVVDAALDSVGPSAQAKQIRLSKLIDPLAGPVSGDPNRLQQVVWNLLSNAVKFTPKGGSIQVNVAQVSSQIEIVVSDSGIGIRREFLPHMFERFRQADSSTTRNYGGLGLGLSIVKQLVELHGGTVRAESAGEGAGATFVVTLPRAAVREKPDQTQPPTRTSVPRQSTTTLAQLKVVLVDDEPDARELLQQVLAMSGAEVSIAATADEALELVKQTRPDVLVSDIGMPKKDGYQLMREIRALPANGGGKTLAIALTAFARSEDRTRAMLAGFQMHIAKPIEPLELIATIASLTGRTGGDS